VVVVEVTAQGMASAGLRQGRANAMATHTTGLSKTTDWNWPQHLLWRGRMTSASMLPATMSHGCVVITWNSNRRSSSAWVAALPLNSNPLTLRPRRRNSLLRVRTHAQCLDSWLTSVGVDDAIKMACTQVPATPCLCFPWCSRLDTRPAHVMASLVAAAQGRAGQGRAGQGRVG
jgi:hypothetical protein